MRKMLTAVLLSLTLAFPVSASELTAPEVYPSGQELMPGNTESFGDGLLELLQNSIKL